jgi:ornithine cyclodeaminase/alanine dehydrogenase-like protein (mu-crystallin family)
MSEFGTIRFLSAGDVRKALPMADAIVAMKDAFRELSAGRVHMPVRAHIDVPEHDGTALFMPSCAAHFGAFAVKTVNVFGHNVTKGLPRIQALVAVFDRETGTPLAVVDGTVLTALRTGAASGAATDLLARSDAAVVAIFGAGVQGRTQLEAVCAVRAVAEVRIYDAVTDAAGAFADETAGKLDLDVRVASSPADALRDADVVCTATVSATPVFGDADLAPGTHINAVGSYQPQVQEIPEETVLRARVVVDHRESALVETGDLIIPIGKGLMTPDDIVAELGEVVSGELPGRTSAEDVTLFKSVGVAVQDLAAGALALKRAEEMGLGTVVNMR